MFDKLWFRNDLAWPENDQPNELRTARIFNLLYHKLLPDPNIFWKEYHQQKTQDLFLIYADFDNREPKCSYSNLGNFLPQIQERLLLWERKPSSLPKNSPPSSE